MKLTKLFLAAALCISSANGLAVDGPIIARRLERGDFDSNPQQFSRMVPSGRTEVYTPFKLQDHPVIANGRLSRRGISANQLILVPTETPLRNAAGRVLRDAQRNIRYKMKKVRAGEYYNQLNQFERFLSTNGYTLRKDYANNRIKRLVLSPTELAQWNTQRAITMREHNPRPDLRAGHVRLVADQENLIRSRDVQRRTVGDNRRIIRMIRMRPIVIRPGVPAPPPPQPKTFKVEKSWSKNWGWDNKFSAYVKSSFKLEGTSTKTESTAKGEAGGRIFGKKLRLIRGESWAKTPKTGNLRGRTYAYVLGFKIIDQSYNKSESYFTQSNRSKNFDENKTIRFTLGPIPMRAKIGGQGSSRLNFRWAFLPLRANADIKPKVSARAYIQAGVDIVVAGAGAGANLVLVRDTLDVLGRIKLTVKNNTPQYVANISAYNDLEALKGSMHVYVYVYKPRWGIPPWKKKTWKWDIFKFDGIKTKGTVVSYYKKLNLY